MGKRENSTTSKWKKPRKAKADVWKHEDGLVRENALFEKYYAFQQMMTEEEFPAFLSCLVDLKRVFDSRKPISPSRCD